jgi:hypothetical protein
MKKTSNTDERRLLYKLMSDALIDIRTVAYEGGDHQGIFGVADLFHNVPLRLERQNGSYDEVLRDMRAHADRNGICSWLDNAIERIERAE